MSSLWTGPAAWLVAAAGMALLLLAVVRLRRNRILDFAKKIPGPPTVPLLGNALIFMSDPEDMMQVLAGLIRRYGDLVRLWMGPDLNVVVADPDDLKLVLSSPRMSVKGPTYKYMAEYIGGGILSGSGTAWRRHRKIASPNYGRRAIESYSAVFERETRALLVRLRGAARAGELDVYNEVVKTTSYSVCQTLMALSKEETMGLPHLDDLIRLTERFYTDVFDRMTKWYYQINLFYWFTDAYRFSRLFHEMSKKFSTAIIEHRKRSLKDIVTRADFTLDTDEDSSKNTELGVIDRFILSEELDLEEMLGETYTIFTSSQEASAKIASYMLLMMAYHPEHQDRLHSEIVSALGDRSPDEPLSGEELKTLPYLDRVFRECVRLFPIGAVIQRTVTEDFTISSCTLPAGTSLLAPIYQISRDPRYWERPEDFHPDHFTSESVAKRPANCYLPFSVGPMDCLGRHFGTKLIKTIVVNVIREFRLTSNQTYKDLRLKVAVSIASKSGFKMFLHPRA